MKKGKLFGKRNLVIVAVLLLVCGAAYLNWSYNNKWGGADAAMSRSEEKGDPEIAEDVIGVEPEEDTLDAQSGVSSDYFAAARLSRQASRDEALTLLETAVTAETASQEVIDAAMNEITDMASWSMLETQIENLILAKGYEDCVAYLADSGVTLAVPAPVDGLTEQDIARVTEAVTSETAYTVAQITVIEVKG